LNRTWSAHDEAVLWETATGHPESTAAEIAGLLAESLGRPYTEDMVRNKLKRMRAAGEVLAVGPTVASLTATAPLPAVSPVITMNPIDGSGSIQTPDQDTEGADFESVLRDFGFNPDAYEILEPVGVRAWENSTGKHWSYTARIKRRARAEQDVSVHIAEVQRHKMAKGRRIKAGDSALVVGLSDWQIGKRGTAAVTARVLALGGQILQRTEELRAAGRKVDTLYLVGLGDVIEACDGHYAMQAFEVELDERDQVKLARRLIVQIISDLAPHFKAIVVPCVPGNHGENRRAGKAFTSFGDNLDVAVFEQASEVIAATPGMSHVEFIIPNDELSITLDIKGTIVALAHGHQVRSGGARGVKGWWSKQSFGMQPSMGATILLTGHFHHLVVDQDGPRTHFQCPTLDDGSPWFEATNGVSSIAGTLTFLVGPEGWSDMEVLN
jgi:predicted phosphodiesterase